MAQKTDRRRDTDKARIARRYALGQSNERERDQFEVTLLSDPCMAEFLEEAEFDLCEAYLKGLLTKAERSRFETFFLRSDVHQAMLASMAVLNADTLFSGGYQSSEGETPAMPGAWAFPRIRGGLVTAAAALLIITAVVAAVVLLGDPLGWRRKVAGGREPTRATSTTIENNPQVNQGTRAGSANHDEGKIGSTEGGDVSHEMRNGNITEHRSGRVPGTLAVFEVALGPQRAPGEPPTAHLSKGTRALELRIRLVEVDLRDYRVTLTGPGAIPIVTADPTLNSKNRTLSVVVRKDLLAQGDYTLTVSGQRQDGQQERVGTASFRIISSLPFEK
jgi:hypothetical protein